MLGIYTRISKDRKNQISTKLQRDKGIELSKKLQIPYTLYEEAKGTSGGKLIADRPVLNKLVADIYDDKIKVVYFYNQDRSTRDEVTWFTLANLLIEKDVKLYENGLLLDLKDEDTYMLSGFKAIMNASERKKTGKKIKDALYKKAKDGIATNPVLPYGYTKDEKKYIIVDDEEAKIVKRIFEMSLSGIGVLKISYILNDEGIKTRYAKNAKGTLTTKNKLTGVVTTKNKADVKWQDNSVRQILKNTWYIGQRQYKGEVFDVPSILPESYWQKVNNNLSSNAQYSGKQTNKWLLKGVLKCVCGCNMYGKHYEPKNENYYRCSSKRIRGKNCGNRSINRPSLDKFIWNRFFIDKHLSKLIVKHFKNVDEKKEIFKLDKLLIQLEKKLKLNNNEKNNAITLATKGIITIDESEGQLKRIRTEKNDIDLEILNTKDQIKSYSDIVKSSSYYLDELKKNEEETSYNDKKEIIHKYIKSITVSGIIEDIECYFVTISFNVPNINDENYLIIKSMDFGIELLEGKLVPISDAWMTIPKSELKVMGIESITDLHKKLEPYKDKKS